MHRPMAQDRRVISIETAENGYLVTVTDPNKPPEEEGWTPAADRPGVLLRYPRPPFVTKTSVFADQDSMVEFVRQKLNEQA